MYYFQLFTKKKKKIACLCKFDSGISFIKILDLRKHLLISDILLGI